MIFRKFIAENDSEHGNFGFKPLWIENANSGDGLSCAHDVLEHSIREPNAGVGEIMAMGSVIYTRGVPGWFETERPHSAYKPHQQIATTVIETMRRVRELNVSHALLEPGKTSPLPCEYAEQMVQDTLRSTKELWHRELDESEPAFNEKVTDSELVRIEGWLRRGYRRALRRFGEGNEWEVSRMFSAISSELDRQIKNAYERVELIVRVDRQALRFTAELSEW